MHDTVALTAALIACRSVTPNDAGCMALIEAELSPCGFKTEYLDFGETRNLYMRRGTEGPLLVFLGHTDVVPVDGQPWTTSPFALTKKEDRLYGRGTCDMKGGLAAAIIATEAILDERIPFRGAIEISGTVDEETGGFGGVAFLARQGFLASPRVDHVIIPEPLGVDRICLGHRGVWWSEVQTHGRIAHGSDRPFGDAQVCELEDEAVADFSC